MGHVVIGACEYINTKYYKNLNLLKDEKLDSIKIPVP